MDATYCANCNHPGYLHTLRKCEHCDCTDYRERSHH